MEFQLSYFKPQKMMLLKCCTQYASKIGTLSSGHRTGKGQFSFHFQRMLKLPRNYTHLTSLVAQTVKRVYNVGEPGSIPGLGRSPGEGNGNPLQDYCLENPMDRGAW